VSSAIQFDLLPEDIDERKRRNSEGSQRKEKGKFDAYYARLAMAEEAKRAAVILYRNGSYRHKNIGITSDDVCFYFEKNGRDLRKVLGNAMGSLFSDGAWEYVRHVKSDHIPAHAREIKAWRLRGE
jgi:hypothetical protein